MKTLKYTIIKNSEQYGEYCNILEGLILHDNEKFQEEIELLTLLIEKWDNEHSIFLEVDPIKLLKSLMVEHNLKAKDLVGILDLSKSTVSKILNYHKGLSKESIRKLSSYFKMTQEAFNRSYPLINAVNRRSRNTRRVNVTRVHSTPS